MTPEQKKIFDYLKRQSSSTVSLIAIALSLSTAVVEESLATLVEQGKIEHGGRRYFIDDTQGYEKSRLIARVQNLFIRCNLSDTEQMGLLGRFQATNLHGLSNSELEQLIESLRHRGTGDLVADDAKTSIREQEAINREKILNAISSCGWDGRKLDKQQRKAIAKQAKVTQSTVNRHLSKLTSY